MIQSWLSQRWRFVQWLAQAKTVDHLDSPFLFELYQKVVLNKIQDSSKNKSSLSAINQSKSLSVLCNLLDYHKYSEVLVIGRIDDKTHSVFQHFSTDVNVVNHISEGAATHDLLIFGELHKDMSFQQLVNFSRLSETIIISNLHGSAYANEFWKQAHEQDEWNCYVDLWYWGYITFNTKIKESISVQLNPYGGRWKPGLTRT